jgi:hypothetical protein
MSKQPITNFIKGLQLSKSETSKTWTAKLWRVLLSILSFFRARWAYVGKNTLSEPMEGATGGNFDIAHNQNNQVFVAFRDSAYNNRLSVKTWVNNEWRYVGETGFSSTEAYYSSLWIEGESMYVAYTRAWGNAVWQANVMKYDGVSWTDVGGGAVTSHIGADPRVVVNNGELYLLFRDGANTNFPLSLMKYDGLNWNYIGGAGDISQGSGSESISICFNGLVPYVAYSDSLNGNRLWVKRYINNSWQSVGNQPVTVNEAYYPSMVVYEGKVALGFKDYDAGEKNTVLTFDGTSWSSIGLSGFSYAGKTAFQYLSLSDNNELHIAFTDGQFNGRITVMKYINNLWQLVENPKFSEDTSWSGHMTIAGNKPYVVFEDFANKGKINVMTVKPPFSLRPELPKE